jgi:hypothetical protein
MAYHQHCQVVFLFPLFIDRIEYPSLHKNLGMAANCLCLCSTAAGAASVRIAVQKAAALAGDAEFSYAINAARRAEKRRIHAFVRLLDYIVCSALHALLVGSVHDMLSAFTPAARPSQLASPDGTEEPSIAGSGAKQATDGM